MSSCSVYDELFYAAKNGIPSVVQELIASGVDVNVTDKWERTPLIVSLGHWHPDTAIKLIESGANLNLTDREGFTPLMLAIQNNMPKVSQILISKGCNVTRENSYNETPLHITLKTCESTINLHTGANSEYPYNDPHMQFAIGRTLDLVKLLIDNGCDVNVRNTRNQIALHFTSRIPACAKYLLEHGSKVDVLDTMERTPLTVAVEHRSIEVIELLIHHGANPNLGRSLNFDLWFYPLDPLQFKILTFLMKFQWKYSFNRKNHVSPKDSNGNSSEGYDTKQRLNLLNLAYLTGSCNQCDLFRFLYHPDFKNTWQSSESIREWLQNMYKSPMSLKNASRIAILRYLNLKRKVNIDEWNIPAALKSFLRMSDIVHE